MAMQTASWEDDENNRIVQLSVEFNHTDGRIEIERVTPTSILFVEAATGQPSRQIKVWTDKGRELLRRQHAAQVDVDTLRGQLESDTPAIAS